MKIRLVSSVMILMLSVSVISGCSSNVEEPPEVIIPAEPLYETYLHLTSSETFMIDDRIDWMNTNTMRLSSEEASLVLLDFEEKHLEESFMIMEELFDLGFEEIIQSRSIEAIESLDFETDSLELKERVAEVLSQGYKFVAVEGSFNVIVDYAFYDGYKAYATEDVMTYFELMKTESENVPLKDAAIVIAWRELFDRTIGWEKLITDFPESSLYDRINQRLSWYRDWSFNGSPNTPVFEWDTKILTESYRTGIESFLNQAVPGEFKTQMQIFYDMVKENGYKQNGRIKEFQNNYKVTY